MKRVTSRYLWAARAATVFYLAAIFVLSLIPGDEVPLENVSDKYRHAAAYAGFAVLLGCSVMHWRWASLPFAFLMASGVGVLVEVIQPHFHRTRDPMDALANSIGAAIGCLLVGSAIYLRSRQVR